MTSIFSGKTIVVTGGTGSFGKAVTRRLLDEHNPSSVRIFSRDELKQWEMAREFNNDERLRFLIGDVRDAQRVERAFEGADFIIHAAALKHVPACEYNPMEAVKTNVDGTINVINAALNANVGKVITLSTDKASRPVNTYGATKLVAERTTIQSNSYTGQRKTRFSAVRYGNVMGSRGSVIPLFRAQSTSGTVTITDSEMTRFWITLPQAVDFVLSCFEIMKGGEVFVPKIPSMKITDLALVIAPDAEHKVTGIRPGEKLHESLLAPDESPLVHELDDKYVVLPQSADWVKDYSDYESYPIVPAGFSYDSFNNSHYLTQEELRAILEELGL